jgi:hypothetical protein
MKMGCTGTGYRGTIPLKRIHRIKKERSALCGIGIFHNAVLFKKYIAKQWIPGKINYPTGGQYRRLIVIPIIAIFRTRTITTMYGFCSKGWLVKHRHDSCWEREWEAKGFRIPHPDLPQDAKDYLRYGRVPK